MVQTARLTAAQLVLGAKTYCENTPTALAELAWERRRALAGSLSVSTCDLETKGELQLWFSRKGTSPEALFPL